jgi:hypothetical protein
MKQALTIQEAATALLPTVSMDTPSHNLARALLQQLAKGHNPWTAMGELALGIESYGIDSTYAFAMWVLEKVIEESTAH